MFTRILMTSAVALALAAPAGAQTTPPTPQPAPAEKMAPPSGSGTTSSAPSTSAPSTAAPSATAGSFITEQKSGEDIASELIGMSVVNAEGKSIGKVSDLIVDSDKKVTGAVLSVGGFLGLGSKSVAVPLDALSIQKSGKDPVAMISMSEQQLADAPEFQTREKKQAAQEAEQRRMQSTTPRPSGGAAGGLPRQ